MIKSVFVKHYWKFFVLAACLGGPSFVFSSGCVCLFACSDVTMPPFCDQSNPSGDCKKRLWLKIQNSNGQGLQKNFFLTIKANNNQTHTFNCGNQQPKSSEELLSECYSPLDKTVKNIFIDNFQADIYEITLQQDSKTQVYSNLRPTYSKEFFESCFKKDDSCNIAVLTLDVD